MERSLLPYLCFLLVASFSVVGGIAVGTCSFIKESERAAEQSRADRAKARSIAAQKADKNEEEMEAKDGKTETATFAAGCFWCVEAVLERVDGVEDVVSGYMGGTTQNPTYADVCTGQTGHAEVVQVTFDPARVSYENLLEWFWQLHDPTTLNRQGADVGTQYRSAIFYHDEAQRQAAEASMASHASDFGSPIVTEVTAASEFYVAEVDHQDYYRLNPNAGYCRAVIAPKLEKLEKTPPTKQK